MSAVELGIDRAPARTGAILVLRRPGGLAPRAASYGAIFTTNVRNQLAYLGEWTLRGVFLAMVLYIFLQLWQATFHGRVTVAGFTIAQMLWYMALTESIILSRPRLNQEVDRQVRTGDVAYVLVRPYDFAGYHLAAYAGERVLRFLTTLVAGVVVCLLFVGPVPLDGRDVAGALVALAGSMLIDFLVAFAIGLLAFWTEDTVSIALLYDRLLMLLGGTLLPLSAFPAAVAAVVRAMPFAALVYGPAALALGAPDPTFSGLILQQGVTLVVVAALVWLLYRAAMRRVTANGG